MCSRFRLQLDVVLDSDLARLVVEAARQRYSAEEVTVTAGRAC